MDFRKSIDSAPSGTSQWVQSFDAERVGRRVAGGTAEVADAQGATERRREHQGVGGLASDVQGEFIDEEPVDRDVPSLVPLGRPPKRIRDR